MLSESLDKRSETIDLRETTEITSRLISLVEAGASWCMLIHLRNMYGTRWMTHDPCMHRL